MDQTTADSTTGIQVPKPAQSTQAPNSQQPAQLKQVSSSQSYVSNQVSKPSVENAKPPIPPSSPKEDNVIYIGKKGVMGYVLAVVTSFNKGFQEVTIKARGHLISRAVDVEEVVKHRFIPEVKIKDIRIMTEYLQSKEGHQCKVSAIEIVLSK